MIKIRKLFITNCILMAICAVLIFYNVMMFDATRDLLENGGLSVIAGVLLIPLFFLAALATLVMGCIQISMSLRNLIKHPRWYTIMMFVLSVAVAVVPIVTSIIILN